MQESLLQELTTEFVVLELHTEQKLEVNQFIFCKTLPKFVMFIYSVLFIPLENCIYCISL